LAVDLERLKPKAQVRFPMRDEVVTLVAVTPGPFWEFFFDGPSGPGKHVLAESELSGIELVEATGALRFDGDPVQFRLGIEAHRLLRVARRRGTRHLPGSQLPRSAGDRLPVPPGAGRHPHQPLGLTVRLPAHPRRASNPRPHGQGPGPAKPQGTVDPFWRRDAD
jgi:hypothetical protein